MSVWRRRALVTIAALWTLYAIASVIAAANATKTVCGFGVCTDPIAQPFDWTFLFVRLIVSGLVAALLAALAVYWLRPAVTDATSRRAVDDDRDSSTATDSD